MPLCPLKEEVLSFLFAFGLIAGVHPSRFGMLCVFRYCPPVEGFVVLPIVVATHDCVDAGQARHSSTRTNDDAAFALAVMLYGAKNQPKSILSKA